MKKLRFLRGAHANESQYVKYCGMEETTKLLRNKSDLREMNVYKKSFLEQDLSREEREKRRERVQERKAEWEKRGKNVEKRN